MAKENIGKGEAQSIDSKQARQVEDTTQEKDFDQKVDEGPKQRKKTYVSQNRIVEDNVTPEARNQVKEEAKSTIGTLVSKGKTPSEVVKALDTEAKKRTFKEVKGKKTVASQAYKDFVNNLFDTNFIKAISVADMKSRFPGLFNVKETGKTLTKGISPITGKPGSWNKPDEFSGEHNRTKKEIDRIFLKEGFKSDYHYLEGHVHKKGHKWKIYDFIKLKYYYTILEPNL